MDVSRTVVKQSIGAWEDVGVPLPFWKEKEEIMFVCWSVQWAMSLRIAWFTTLV